MKYIFITNGRADKQAVNESISTMISETGGDMDWEIYVTKAPGDATVFVRKHCEDHISESVCYVACGGDGTINEVASGLTGMKNKYLAIIAVGTGNDFVKYYPNNDFHSIRGILNGSATKIDILKINDSRYSINVCNIGFDAAVCSIANSLSVRGAANAYRKGILLGILKHRFDRIVITADGERLNRRRLLLCTMANNHYVGGEFCCAPKSLNDDGLIDVCMIRPILLIVFILVISKYRNGRHLDSPMCRPFFEYRRARHIEIHSKKKTEICLDGEMYAGKDFTVDILPGAINLIIPKEK